MTRITEPDLVLPALYIIHRNPGITTTELSHELRKLFNPVGEDSEILSGRSDDKFSQIVRNLVSHHTLDRRSRFTVLDVADPGSSRHTITDRGLAYLWENIQSLESLFSNDLDYQETVDGVVKIGEPERGGRQITVYDENTLIIEGRGRLASTTVYERSKALRDRAIEAYTKDGRIFCEACGFDFYERYGAIGQGYIEIHHQKPVFQYEEDDFEKIIKDALKNLVPLCSNCHRMVHRRREGPLSIEELRGLLNK